MQYNGDTSEQTRHTVTASDGSWQADTLVQPQVGGAHPWSPADPAGTAATPDPPYTGHPDGTALLPPTPIRRRSSRELALLGLAAIVLTVGGGSVGALVTRLGHDGARPLSATGTLGTAPAPLPTGRAPVPDVAQAVLPS